jgi:TRAP-type mannitol/chloroaromatic compound transport system substrate-binding protein
MKRRNFLSAAGLGLGGAIISAPAIARSRPEVRWRMVSSFPRSLDILQGGAEFLARRVADLTGGGFQIQVLPRVRRRQRSDYRQVRRRQSPRS